MDDWFELIPPSTPRPISDDELRLVAGDKHFHAAAKAVLKTIKSGKAHRHRPDRLQSDLLDVMRDWLIAKKDPRLTRLPNGDLRIDRAVSCLADFCRYLADLAEQMPDAD